ncbi:DUF397 domain-containing protein [Streptomyces sp. Tu 2975]|uniref:DUF397 domain-containing protein n=1 Tax=Streptomyces sp. Tu 2975 TaxID=2676871 RepID=UPI00135CDE52|nr:DUF397 domain-containing protein [Streptomyces sp. Tu 2975]QIP85772.1 DUF397 domain-containing protein [Streptomyces sp. Tu 2975]
MLESAWQKSSYCGEGDACVNVTADTTGVRLTESSDPDGHILHTTPYAFASLICSLKDGTPSPDIAVTRTADGLVRIGAVVTTTAEKWDAFVLGVRAGEFDHFGQGVRSLVRQT